MLPSAWVNFSKIAFQLFHGYAGSRVLHRNQQSMPCASAQALRPKPDGALFSELDGVAQEVRENLAQPQGIGFHQRRQVRRQVHAKLHAFANGEYLVRASGLFDQVARSE